MSALKDASQKLMLGNQEVSLLFSLNVLDEVQDRFGGYDKISEHIHPEKCKEWVKNIRWLLTILINEGLPDGAESFTEQQIGKKISMSNISQVRDAIFAAFVNGTNPNAETDDTEGNQAAAQE